MEARRSKRAILDIAAEIIDGDRRRAGTIENLSDEGMYVVTAPKIRNRAFSGHRGGDPVLAPVRGKYPTQLRSEMVIPDPAPRIYLQYRPEDNRPPADIPEGTENTDIIPQPFIPGA